MYQLKAWPSRSELGSAGAQEGKEAWPLVQQPVFCWVPGQPPVVRVFVPRTEAALRASWGRQPWVRLGLSSCHLGGAQEGELRS